MSSLLANWDPLSLLSGGTYAPLLCFCYYLSLSSDLFLFWPRSWTLYPFWLLSLIIMAISIKFLISAVVLTLIFLTLAPSALIGSLSVSPLTTHLIIHIINHHVLVLYHDNWLHWLFLNVKWTSICNYANSRTISSCPHIKFLFALTKKFSLRFLYPHGVFVFATQSSFSFSSSKVFVMNDPLVIVNSHPLLYRRSQEVTGGLLCGLPHFSDTL